MFIIQFGEDVNLSMTKDLFMKSVHLGIYVKFLYISRKIKNRFSLQEFFKWNFT